jgi:beta-glucanase (GH16 family)
MKVGKGWPAFWLLGGNGLTSGSTGCQFQSVFNTWDNPGNCNWSQDSGSPGDSAETDIMEYVEPTYTDTNQNLFSNGATNLGSSQTITDGSANFHVYTLHWSNTSLTYAIDGTASTTHYTTNVPQNPQFIILENRIQTGAGKVPGTFPQVMTVQYVQVCDGTTCTSPGAAGGNNVFFDNFTPPPARARVVTF